MFDDNKKLGIGLCGIGFLMMFLGVFLMFDRILLSLGNFGFLFGLCMLLGPAKMAKFFFRKEKAPATGAFFGGFFLIIMGYSFFGFVLQMYGIWKLFAAFLPNVIAALKLVPGVGPLLSIPPFSYLVGAASQGSTQLPI